MMGLKTTLAVALFSVPTAALAKSKREGFNFGANWRAVGVEDQSLGLNDDKSRSVTSKDETTATPYVGYVAADWLNLGVNATIETLDSKEQLTKEGSDERIIRDRRSKLQGGSLFMRFLFARVLYFEAGFGLYRRSVSIFNEVTVAGDDGQFTGRKDEIESSGIGPGYHLAAGMEFPMAYGFYFTTAYTNRIYQLRDFKGEGNVDLGRRTGRERKREVSFGVAYYYQD